MLTLKDGKARTRIIAIEERYLDPQIGANFTDADAFLPHQLRQRLEDLGASRLKQMDDSGTDVQILSHAGPATQRTDPNTAVKLARAANGRLYEIIRLERGGSQLSPLFRHPTRRRSRVSVPLDDVATPDNRHHRDAAN